MFIHLSQPVDSDSSLWMDRPHCDLVLEKEISHGVDAHGTIIAELDLSELIYGMIFFLLSFILIGWPLLILLAGLSFVYPLIGAAKASQGDICEYPGSLNIIKFSFKPRRQNESFRLRKHQEGNVGHPAPLGLFCPVGDDPLFTGLSTSSRKTLKMVLGFPSWVFWGIALPGWDPTSPSFFLFVSVWQRIPSMPMSRRKPTRHPPKGNRRNRRLWKPFSDPGSQPTQGGASVRLDQLRCLHNSLSSPSHGLQGKSPKGQKRVHERILSR